MSMSHRVEVVGSREPSLGEGLSRVMELSERVIFDHLELLKLDLQDRVRSSVRRLGVMAVAGTLLLLAWTSMVGALLVTLSDRFSWEVLLLGVSAFHVCLAVGLVLTAPVGTAPKQAGFGR